jgi:RNA-dependent RNA polymerase
MERLKISWGVQYELARGVLAEEWTWADVNENVLGHLRGSNVQAAPKVRSVMLEAKGAPRRKSSGNLAIW